MTKQGFFILVILIFLKLCSTSIPDDNETAATEISFTDFRAMDNEPVVAKMSYTDNFHVSENSLKLEIQYKWRNFIQNKYPNAMKEAADLIFSCFPDPEFTDPNDHHRNMDRLQWFLSLSDSSGFYFKGQTLVGFIMSKKKYRTLKSLDVELYSVCVKESERGNGIAKSMINEYLNGILTEKIENIYVGLSVLFTSESAVSAFKLYAKMGFNRWWEFCSGTCDFSKLDNQEKLANPSSGEIIYQHPMSKFILNRKLALNEISDKKYLCMIMKWKEDDFETIGRDIQNKIQLDFAEKSK